MNTTLKNNNWKINSIELICDVYSDTAEFDDEIMISFHFKYITNHFFKLFKRKNHLMHYTCYMSEIESDLHKKANVYFNEIKKRYHKKIKEEKRLNDLFM